MDSTCCDDANGTFLGTGAICEGDLNGNGIDDACDCDVLTGERIILRSGNGAVGGFDTAITVLPGVSNFPLSAFPFTPLDFLQACVLGPASVIAPNGAWLPGSAGVLPSDPLAQWIGPFPNSAGGSFAQPASGLFCQPFDVCCEDITAATITIAFAADDQIGDIPFGPNNIGVYLNGPPGLLGFSGIGFGSEIIIAGPAVGLLPGGNTLHVYLRDVHAVASGVIYSVTIDVDCAEEACCFPDEHCEDLDPCCCRDLGGTPQGTGTDCASVDCPPHDPPFCPLPATGGLVDPCFALQLTDCDNGNPGELCLPICVENQVQVDGTVVAVATKCDCIEGDECGPVKIVDNGIFTEFVCDPTICPDPLDECWIHINGSPIGASSIATSAVPVGAEVKCKCAHTEGDPCPTPLPPMLDPCGALQVTDCKDGLAGETCLPICVEIIQDAAGFTPVATLCDCIGDDSCGPVQIEQLPDPPGGFRLTCDPTLCPDPLETCQVHLNGSPTGQTSVDVDTLLPSTEVKCKCSSTPNDPCPTPLPPSDDPCGTLQATDCSDGMAGERCLPICVEISQDATGLVPDATVCDCVEGNDCGPVHITELPAPAGFNLSCDPNTCPTPGVLCQVHINGMATGSTSVDVNSLGPGTEVKCGCPIATPLPAPAPHDILKNRYISIDPRGTAGANVGQDFDIKVTLTSSLVDGQLGNGPWWAGPPDAQCLSVVVQGQPGVPTNWDACPTLHLTGCPIIPTSDYDIVAVLDGTDSAPPLAAETQAKPGFLWHGDVVGSFDGENWSAPNGVVNAADFQAVLFTFQDPNAGNATHVSVTDVHPQFFGGPHNNRITSINDVLVIILGFQGREYPEPDLTLCP
ncbi:MAG: hypothetical protein IIC02_05835 [Planctomycetes bacterium]|nr:hypothetical protein [Planctomycetota bacterium]